MKSNKELFLETYKIELLKARTEQPDIYAWPIEEIDVVFDRIKAAVLRGSFNKDSVTFRCPCKALKIKHTYIQRH